MKRTTLSLASAANSDSENPKKFHESTTLLNGRNDDTRSKEFDDHDDDDDDDDEFEGVDEEGNVIGSGSQPPVVVVFPTKIAGINEDTVTNTGKKDNTRTEWTSADDSRYRNEMKSEKIRTALKMRQKGQQRSKKIAVRLNLDESKQFQQEQSPPQEDEENQQRQHQSSFGDWLGSAMLDTSLFVLRVASDVTINTGKAIVTPPLQVLLPPLINATQDYLTTNTPKRIQYWIVLIQNCIVKFVQTLIYTPAGTIFIERVLVFCIDVLEVISSESFQQYTIDCTASWIKFWDWLSTTEFTTFLDQLAITGTRGLDVLSSTKLLLMDFIEIIQTGTRVLSSTETITAVAEITSQLCYALETERMELIKQKEQQTIMMTKNNTDKQQQQQRKKSGIRLLYNRNRRRTERDRYQQKVYIDTVHLLSNPNTTIEDAIVHSFMNNNSNTKVERHEQKTNDNNATSAVSSGKKVIQHSSMTRLPSSNSMPNLQVNNSTKESFDDDDDCDNSQKKKQNRISCQNTTNSDDPYIRKKKKNYTTKRMMGGGGGRSCGSITTATSSVVPNPYNNDFNNDDDDENYNHVAIQEEENEDDDDDDNDRKEQQQHQQQQQPSSDQVIPGTIGQRLKRQSWKRNSNTPITSHTVKKNANTTKDEPKQQQQQIKKNNVGSSVGTTSSIRKENRSTLPNSMKNNNNYSPNKNYNISCDVEDLAPRDPSNRKKTKQQDTKKETIQLHFSMDDVVDDDDDDDDFVDIDEDDLDHDDDDVNGGKASNTRSSSTNVKQFYTILDNVLSTKRTQTVETSLGNHTTAENTTVGPLSTTSVHNIYTNGPIPSVMKNPTPLNKNNIDVPNSILGGETIQQRLNKIRSELRASIHRQQQQRDGISHNKHNKTSAKQSKSSIHWKPLILRICFGLIGMSFLLTWIGFGLYGMYVVVVSSFFNNFFVPQIQSSSTFHNNNKNEIVIRIIRDESTTTGSSTTTTSSTNDVQAVDLLDYTKIAQYISNEL